MTDADKILQIKCRGSSLAQIDELHEFQGDLKALSSDSLKKLEKVLLRHGFSEPIAVWRDGHKLCILNGHQRLIALKSLRSKGYHVPAIPIVEVDAKDAKEAKEKVLALTSQYGELSAKSVSDFMIASDVSLDFLNEHLRMPEVNFGKIQLQETGSSGDEDEVPPVPPKVNIKLGDLFVLGRHRLMCGDSTNNENVKRLMNGEKPILMVTDPPYGVEYDATWREDALGDKLIGKPRDGKVANDDRADWFEVWQICNADIAYVWHASAFSDVVMDSLRRAQFDVRQQIIWNKSVLIMGRSAYHWKHEPCWYAVRKGCDANWKGDRKQVTVWDAAPPTHIMSGSKEDRTAHPTQKPVLVYEIPIQNHTNKNDLLFEPFSGSGTAFIACEKTERRVYGMELDEAYVALILDRWQKFTGQQAMREDGRLWDDIKSE